MLAWIEPGFGLKIYARFPVVFFLSLYICHTTVRLQQPTNGGAIVGLHCAGLCTGHCKFKASCDPETGKCRDGLCAAGYKGEQCNEPCDPGSFGENCKEACFGKCLNNEACDAVTGYCPFFACATGFTGPNCNLACPKGYYGQNCKFPCSQNCLITSETCHPVHGWCPNKKCQLGYRHDNCTEICAANTYGESCSQTCAGHCLLNTTCDFRNGSCPGNLCSVSYTGNQCRTRCPRGRYGAGCSEVCSNNCQDGESCDVVTGTCPGSRCSPGYQSENCKQKCPYGTYGGKCGFTCPATCFYPQGCHAENGTCIQSGQSWCVPGKSGTHCMNDCPTGFFGAQCKYRCSDCPDSLKCHYITGECVTPDCLLNSALCGDASDDNETVSTKGVQFTAAGESRSKKGGLSAGGLAGVILGAVVGVLCLAAVASYAGIKTSESRTSDRRDTDNLEDKSSINSIGPVVNTWVAPTTETNTPHKTPKTGGITSKLASIFASRKSGGPGDGDNQSIGAQEADYQASEFPSEVYVSLPEREKLEIDLTPEKKTVLPCIFCKTTGDENEVEVLRQIPAKNTLRYKVLKILGKIDVGQSKHKSEKYVRQKKNDEESLA